MASRTGSIGRRRLGIELRVLRERAGLRQNEVTAQTGWSTSKVSRMEKGLVPVSPRDLKDLAELYGITDEDQVKPLLALAAGSRQRDWWHRYDDVQPKQFSIYLGFEGAASSIHTYETLLIPGLLQTEAYSRALFVAAQPDEAAEEIERRIEARQLRQALITGDEAPVLHAIVDEAALRRHVGGTEVMREQLDHLLRFAKRPNVAVQVIPYAAGAYHPMDGGFILLRFADPEDGDVVCVDLLARSLYLDDTGEVRRYIQGWESVLSVASSPAESLKLITATKEQLK